MCAHLELKVKSIKAYMHHERFLTLLQTSQLEKKEQLLCDQVHRFDFGVLVAWLFVLPSLIVVLCR